MAVPNDAEVATERACGRLVESRVSARFDLARSVVEANREAGDTGPRKSSPPAAGSVDASAAEARALADDF
jgi:hypothetical protein